MPVKFRGRGLGGWRANEDGAAAIEFALLVLPFTLMVIVIIEVSLMMANSSILEGATNDAARLIRTGQVQGSAEPEAAFQDALCNHARIMRCSSFQFSVKTLDNFAAADDEEPTFDEDGNLENVDFEAGDSADIVMIQVTYLYRFLTPIVGRYFSNYPNNSRLLMSTIVLQTEPYEFE